MVIARPMPLAAPVTITALLAAAMSVSSGIAIPRSIRQAGRLPRDHLPMAAALGVDVREAHAEGIGLAVRDHLDPREIGRHDGVTQILRRHVGGLDGRVYRGAGLHVSDQALLGIEPRR